MKHVTDASLAHVAPKLRGRDVDCEKVHKLMRNNELSQIKIPDGEIAQFIREAQEAITLIVMDHDLAEHCKFGSCHISRFRTQ